MTLPNSIATFPGSMINFISDRDHRLMRRVNRWPAPRWARVAMIAATRGGDGWLWYGLGFLLLVFGDSQRFAAVCAAALASGTGLGIYLVVKKATGRRRPCLIQPHCWARILPPDQYSFPSGHTITAFSVATSICLFYPSLTAALIVCASMVAISRIILGMHFLSDVVTGAFIGSFLGYAAFSLLR